MTNIIKICPDISELNTVNTSHKCPIENCDVILKSGSNLNMHYKKHHLKSSLEQKELSKDTILQYHCPVTSCIYNKTSNRYFTCKRLLKQHYLKVHADKLFSCSKCSKGFSTLIAKNNHDKICGKVFTCPDCKWEYKSYEALLTHCRRKNHRKTDVQEVKNLNNAIASGKVIILNIIPSVMKITQNKEVQTDVNDDNTPIKKRKRQTQQTQTSITKGKKQKSSVETQTVKTSILEKAMQEANIYQVKSCLKKKSQKSQSDLPAKDHEFKNIKPKTQSVAEIAEKKECKSPNEDYFEKLSYFSNEVEVESSENILAGNILLQTMLNQSNLCNIETQTDKSDTILSENTDSTFTQTADISLDQLLYSNMYTQTCDDILLSELGFNDSHTQTCWLDYEDLVSTETQTNFTDYLFGDRSTQTQNTIPDNVLEQSEQTQTYSSSIHGS